MSHLRRIIKLIFFIICSVVCLWTILNLPVTSKQGVDYLVRTIRIPLYIKIIEFLDRDYHYKELTQRICQKYRSDRDKVLALFKWTHQNIKTNIPENWPIIDDHVWSIIVRGYGVKYQLSDVFATLCNYAGIDAFYQAVYTVDRRKRDVFSFVKIENKWCIFEPYHGIYFKNKDDEIADVDEIKSGGVWSIESLDGKVDIDYAVYLANLPSIKDIGLTRSNIQSPSNRLLFELKKLKN